MRCRDRIDARGGACNDNLVFTQRYGPAVGIEHKHLEGVVARFGQVEFDTCAILQGDASGRPPGVQTVDLKLDSSRSRTSQFGDDLCLRVRRARDVVERQIKRATGADGSSGALASTALRRPIDGLGEDRCAFRNGGHRIHISGRGNTELEGHLVTQGLVVGWATHKDDTFDVVWAQSSLFEGFAGGHDGLFHLRSDQAVVSFAINGDVDVDLLTSLIADTEFGLGQTDDGLFLLRQLDLCLLCRPRGHPQQGLELWIGRQVFRKIKVFQQPRLHDVVEQNPVEVAAATHGDAAVREKCHAAGDALCNCDVERSTAKVIDDKYTVILSLPHDAHHGGYRFLHQGHSPEPSRISGSHRRVLLHLIERGWNGNDGAGVAIAPNLFGQVAVQRTQHLGRAFLWCHGEVHSRELDRRARTHEPLEQHCRVVGVACGIVVGARTDVLVAAPVDEDGRRRDVMLFWTLVEPDRLAVEGADGTVGRAQVDTDILHASTFLSITVPCLRRPFGPMMIGSTI